MTVTNLAIGQQVNLATILNTKLESPILQSEIGLDVAATVTKKAVRWDEFSLKHNNDGTFKAGIIATVNVADLAITTDKLVNLAITVTKLGDAAVTQPKMKTKAVVALADVAATLTGAQMVDSTLFTITPTIARILTTDTAANIVAAMPGYQVGSWFNLIIVNTAAFDVTLAAGTGITLVGKAIINNVSGTWLARIDSATAITIYRG